jgi:hypothetical protein
MTKKDGDRRLLKSGAVYGPMTRDDFDRLRSAGKLGLDDLVSVRGGAWMTLSDYLSASSPAARPDARVPAPPAVATVATSLDEADPVLRLLTGQRIVAALSRADVDQLRQSGRIDDDDLICALYGPWMRVGDFLAAPRTNRPATLLEEHAEASVSLPAQQAPRPIAPVVIPGPTAPIAATDLLFAPALGASVDDEWFVRVRGIHSAPLRRRHIKSLFDAKEITRDNVARHSTWPDNAWLPIHAISQLAEAVA